MYEAVIGLEVHVQLKTKTKMFCGCLTEFGNQPNSQICPVCLGLPGSLPVVNKRAFHSAVKVAVALGCRVAEFTKFDRKNYFYPDLPKNYQISQYDLPFGQDGVVEIDAGKTVKPIRIKRVHLEEDAGKLIHDQAMSLVDFNRTGMPLLEIVSQPDINSPQEAYDYLVNLKQIIRYLGVSSCDMEKGILRCDANVSVRIKGESVLGTKAEVKNMNSFRGVRNALAFEIKRQVKALEAGEKVIQETRLWDEGKQKTYSMRLKEGEQDYRYFPEPDLAPFTISPQLVKEIKQSLSELPRQKQKRFMADYQLSEYDTNLLTSEKEWGVLFEACFKLFPEAKLIANWICGPLFSELNSRNLSISELSIQPQDLVSLLKLFQQGNISNLVAKNVLTEMIDTGKTPDVIIAEKNLMQVSDEAALGDVISDVIHDNPKSVEDYVGGKENALMFLVGQVMSKTRGKANPKIVKEVLEKKLKVI